MRSFAAGLLPAFLLCLSAAAAQPARIYSARADTAAAYETRAAANGLIDADEGILRSAYNVRARVRPGLHSEEAALEHLTATPAYGVSTESLLLRDRRGGKYATHLTFQQTFFGLPVYGREVKVNLDAHGQPTLVINGYAPHLDRVEEFDPEPKLTSNDVPGRVAAHLGIDINGTAPRLMAYASNPPRLVWQMTAWNRKGPGEWETVVDAKTGEIVVARDIGLHASGASRNSGSEFAHASHVPTSHLLHPTVLVTDAVGYVFDPDPISSAGVEYGGAYVDANDADVPELNAQRFEVLLRGVSQGSDELYRLEGPYVRIDGATCGPQVYAPPAEPSPEFRYLRAHPGFEAVTIYYHIDKSQRYIQSLDVGFPIREEPVRANPRAYAGDESYWSGGCLKFGTGAIDDAEDADVILHEYGHALLDAAAPGLRSSAAGRGYHEGWGDYWAASYSRYLSEEDPQIPEHNWRKVFNWDGNTSCWQGRPISHPGSYPNNVIVYPLEGGCPGYRDYYQAGMLWATTMMEIYDAVGREVTDRLHLASFGYLSSTAQWSDFAQALLQADRDLYGGAHLKAIAGPLIERGYAAPGTGREEEEAPVSATVPLYNVPNPFSGSTEIRFAVMNQESVRLEVFDVTGRRVRTLVATSLSPGVHTVSWDGRDDTGRDVVSGVYIYQLQFRDARYSRTLLLVR